MIRIGTATDDDDDDEWRESRSTVRGVLAGFESTRQKPTRLPSGVRPPFSLDGPIHLPVVDDAAVVGSGRLSNDPAIVRGSDVPKLHAGGISTDALVSIESTRELCLKGVSMDGPIVHDRGLLPLFLNARMFSGRSMQPCP